MEAKISDSEPENCYSSDDTDADPTFDPLVETGSKKPISYFTEEDILFPTEIDCEKPTRYIETTKVPTSGTSDDSIIKEIITSLLKQVVQEENSNKKVAKKQKLTKTDEKKKQKKKLQQKSFTLTMQKDMP